MDRGPGSIIAKASTRLDDLAEDLLDSELPFGGGDDQLGDCVIVEVHRLAVAHRLAV